jgi:hypothetical protein
VLALNRLSLPAAEVDPAFQLVLPDDSLNVSLAEKRKIALVEAAPNGPLAQAFQEVYRRLSLNHSIGIFIPSTMDVDMAVDNSAQVQEALAFFGTIFGGATRSQAEGCWRSEESGLVIEQVTIVRTFVSKQALETHLDQVVEFATKLKKEMKQEAVAIDVDNQLVLV